MDETSINYFNLNPISGVLELSNGENKITKLYLDQNKLA